MQQVKRDASMQPGDRGGKRGDISEIASPGDRRQTYLATSGDSMCEKKKQVSQTLPEGGEQREQITTTRQRKRIERRKEIDDKKFTCQRSGGNRSGLEFMRSGNF